jgi:hypothetical protein
MVSICLLSGVNYQLPTHCAVLSSLTPSPATCLRIARLLSIECSAAPKRYSDRVIAVYLYYLLSATKQM